MTTSPLSRARVPRLVETAAVRSRLALVPPRASRARRTPFVVLICAVLLAGVIGLLMFNTQMQQRSFEITRLQKQANALDDTVQGLRTRQQRLQNPQHLAAAAKALGMVVPPNPTFISLRNGKVSGVPVMSSMGDGMQIRQSATPKPAQLNPKPRIVRVKPTTKKSATTGAASTSGEARQGRNDGTTNHR